MAGYEKLEGKECEYVRTDKESILFFGGDYPRFHAVIYPRRGGKRSSATIHYDKYLEHSAIDGCVDEGEILDEEIKRIGRIITMPEIKSLYDKLKVWKLN